MMKKMKEGERERIKRKKIGGREIMRTKDHEKRKKVDEGNEGRKEGRSEKKKKRPGREITRRRDHDRKEK